MTRFARTTLSALLPLALALSAGAQSHNTLTAEEEAEGYVLLFNGTDLTGFRQWNSMTPPPTWGVATDSASGAKTLRINATGSQHLITVDSTYQNFDIKLEYKLVSAANSGLFIRYAKHGVEEWGASSGPEAQIVSNNHSDGTGGNHVNGSAYEMFVPQASAANWDRPNRQAGGNNYSQWQQFRIIAYNRRIAHFGNGLKLLEYEMLSPAWETAFAASKYSKDNRSKDGYRGIQPGSFYFQHHGADAVGIQFRSLRAKKLTESPWAKGSPLLVNPEDSTSGLKDMGFDQNVTTSISARRAAARGFDARIERGLDGLSLVFERAGDYDVTVSDLRGKTLFATAARNAERVALSRAEARETLVLSVRDRRAGGAFRKLLAP